MPGSNLVPLSYRSMRTRSVSSKALCARGERVAFVELPGVSHIFVARDAAPTAIRWMNDRFRRPANSFIAANPHVRFWHLADICEEGIRAALARDGDIKRVKFAIRSVSSHISTTGHVGQRTRAA